MPPDPGRSESRAGRRPRLSLFRLNGTLLPVLHPFFFAVAPVLFLFAHNSRKHHVSPTELLIPLAISLALALVGWLVIRFIVRSGARAGLVVSFAMLMFFSWGRLASALHARLDGFRTQYMGFVFLALFLAACVIAARWRREFRGLTVFLNIATGLILILNLGLGLPALLRTRPRPAAPVPGAPGPGEHPDIFYIIPDAYGRSDILADIYNHDNSAFIAGLRARGFYVADRARSNYGQTYLSLGSTLNMSYADSLAEAVGRGSEDRGPLVRWMLANRVMRELRGRGYHIVSFPSGYSGTGFRNADVRLAPRWAMSEFTNLFISLTPLGKLLYVLTDRSQFALHRELVEFVFDRLPTAARGRGPALVIAHILSPHPPFVFGPSGERVDGSGPFNLSDGNHYHHGEPEAVARYIKGYRGQARFVEHRLLETVDEILARSERPPVIIIMSDHGPGSRLHHDDPRWTDFPERTGILYAVLMPDRDYSGWYDSITSVNTFRLVFNRLFDDTLALLPDRSYFATWNRPYEHYDVDEWEAPTIEVPELVGVVAFRQAEFQPAAGEVYFERLVGRRLPGAQVGPVLLYLVDTLPSLEQAYASYRKAVAAGQVPDLGDSYEYFIGNHGSDWRKVLALFFPLEVIPEDSAPRSPSSSSYPLRERGG